MKKWRSEFPEIEISERRICPEEVYKAEDILPVVGDVENEFMEFIFKPEGERLHGVFSDRKSRRFKPAFIDVFTTFTISVEAVVAVNAAWNWVKNRFEIQLFLILFVVICNFFSRRALFNLAGC